MILSTTNNLTHTTTPLQMSKRPSEESTAPISEECKKPKHEPTTLAECLSIPTWSEIKRYSGLNMVVRRTTTPENESPFIYLHIAFERYSLQSDLDRSGWQHLDITTRLHGASFGETRFERTYHVPSASKMDITNYAKGLLNSHVKGYTIVLYDPFPFAFLIEERKKANAKCAALLEGKDSAHLALETHFDFAEAIILQLVDLSPEKLKELLRDYVAKHRRLELDVEAEDNNKNEDEDEDEDEDEIDERRDKKVEARGEELIRALLNHIQSPPNDKLQMFSLRIRELEHFLEWTVSSLTQKKHVQRTVGTDYYITRQAAKAIYGYIVWYSHALEYLLTEEDWSRFCDSPYTSLRVA